MASVSDQRESNGIWKKSTGKIMAIMNLYLSESRTYFGVGGTDQCEMAQAEGCPGEGHHYPSRFSHHDHAPGQDHVRVHPYISSMWFSIGNRSVAFDRPSTGFELADWPNGTMECTIIRTGSSPWWTCTSDI